MKTISSNRILRLNKKLLVGLMVLAIVWFIFAVFAWYKVIYTNPERVFNDMLSKNFSTSGYSRLVSDTSSGMSQQQITQVQFGANNIAQTKLIIKSDKNVEKAQVISTPTADFLRYTSIVNYDENGKLVDNKKVEGVWAKADQAGQLSQSFARQTIFATYFPMGLVTSSSSKDKMSKNEILDFIAMNTVYSPNYKKVKSESINGRQVYTYNVSVQLQSYVAMLQRFAKATGQEDVVAGLNPAEYAGSSPIQLEASVDKLSHRLIRVVYPENKTATETYTGYGINNLGTTVPKNFKSTLELQELFQQ